MSNVIKSKVYYRSEEYPELIKALLWVRRATNPEDVRPWIHYIHIAPGKRVVGADGARMHVVTFGPDDKLPAEGTYLYQPRNQNAGYLVEVEPMQLPKNVFDLLQHTGNGWERIEFFKEKAETRPADLYRLIVKLGVREGRTTPNGKLRPHVFNPDYLTDALEHTGFQVHAGEQRLYMRSPESAGFPVFEAVIAGIQA